MISAGLLDICARRRADAATANKPGASQRGASQAEKRAIVPLPQPTASTNAVRSDCDSAVGRSVRRTFRHLAHGFGRAMAELLSLIP